MRPCLPRAGPWVGMGGPARRAGGRQAVGGRPSAHAGPRQSHQVLLPAGTGYRGQHGSRHGHLPAQPARHGTAVDGAAAVSISDTLRPGRHRRRSWSTESRLHLEVRGIPGAGAAAIADGVTAALRALDGVRWAVFDAGPNRLVVDFDPSLVGPATLLTALERAEEESGVGEMAFSDDLRGEHPADREPLFRQLAALGADGAGLALGAFGRALAATPLPAELASLFSVVDSEPRARALLESLVGRPLTDLGLAVGNAVAQGLGQGPSGLVSDMALRASLIAELLARRGGFERAEAARWGAVEHPDVPRPLPEPGRPCPLPPGPVERHADRSAIAALATAAATYAGTRSARQATSILVAGLPKAARMSRETFCAHLSRALVARDMVVLDASALRRLDRVDTIVVDAGLLHTGLATIMEVRAVGDADAQECQRRLRELFDRRRAREPSRRAGWTLGPPTSAERRRREVRRALGTAEALDAEGPGATAQADPGGRERSADPAAPAGAGPQARRQLLALRRSGHLQAIVRYEEEISAAGEHIVRLARRQGLRVGITGATPGVLERVGGELQVPSGAEAIVALQEEGHVVAVVLEGGPAAAPALRAADVSIELADLGGSSWAGHVVVNGPPDVAFLLQALAAARQVSTRGAALAGGGSLLGAITSIATAPSRAAARASQVVNAAALVGMADGLRAAISVARSVAGVPSQPTEWHALATSEVLEALSSSESGLGAPQAQERRRSAPQLGTPEPSLLRSIAGELVNPLTPVLAGGAAASAAVGSVTDATMVAAVSALNAVVGGVQRFRAERAILSLGESAAQPVRVLRPGGFEDCTPDALVPGDVIGLRAGDTVPADCRILAAEQLGVEESSLTGEPDVVAKGPDPVFAAVLSERTSMLFGGTTIAAGRARAVVVATGAGTVAGTMAADLGSTVASGVEGRLRHLTSVTLPVSLGGGVLMVLSGLARKTPVPDSVSSAVALAVAAVPEGLPILATMAQLASARRLSERGALVRNPRAVEALGRVGVLCTDKTGTVTEGRIRLWQVSDGAVEVGARELAGRHLDVLAAALRASPAAVGGQRLAHHTDQAVVEGARASGVTVTHGAPGWQRREALPFEPGRGYHAALGECGGGYLLSAKGAPEVLLARCERWRAASGPVVLDRRARRALDRKVESLARRGLRILAVAERSADARSSEEALEDAALQGLTLLGFLVLSDPVRPTAPQAVDGLRRAGVRVVMVTGDHPSTAEGIAAELGILDGGRLLTGSDLAAMSDARLDETVSDVSVFARVTPADKVRIVAALQRRGQAVAMTGDGANDAPAIRMADVGIALGPRSTAAARAGADLVVTDERIETIVDAITEGRGMWTSVREALAILLGGNLGEVAFTVLTTLITGSTPLSPRQLLVVNLLTDVAPALAIALRPPPRRAPEALLAEGPEASLADSLERAIALRAATTAAGAGAAWTVARMTGGRRRASTTALVALVGTQLGQTIVSGGLDPLVLAAGGGSALLLAAMVQVPGVSQFFGCTPLGPVAWAIALGSATAATAVSAVGSRLGEARTYARTAGSAREDGAPTGERSWGPGVLAPVSEETAGRR